MARITRKTQKIFAGSATNNGVFGSAQLGTKVLSNNLDTIQGLPAFDTGWLDAVLGNKKFPPLEEFQALDYINTYQTSYLFQEGIPEYDAGTTYYANSIVKKAGTYQLYGSITDTNLGNALTDATKWQFLVDFAATVVTTDVMNFAADTGTANHMIVAPTPAMSAWTAGNTIFVKPAHNITGACDVDVSAKGPKSVKLLTGANPSAGMMNTSGIYCMVYDGTNLVLLNPTLGSGAYLNADNSANNLVKVDSDGKYPALDGSKITNIAAVKKVKVTFFTSSGTYTPDPNLLYATVKIVGGGGMGIGQSTGYYPGGGAGEFAQGTFAAAALGSSVSITIGAGATSTAGPGGTTSFGALMTAVGGQPGAFNLSNGIGGTGGTGGDFRQQGQNGGTGQAGYGALYGRGSGGFYSFAPRSYGLDGGCEITEYCYA